MRVPLQEILITVSATYRPGDNAESPDTQKPLAQLSQSDRPPLAERCGPDTDKIVCINGYSAVMPGNFKRAPPPDSINPLDQASYAQTFIPNDPSWHLVKEADFIVYDKERGLEI